MSRKDQELLTALTTQDNWKFNEIMKYLEIYALWEANSNLPAQLVEDATEYAMDNVVDWLVSSLKSGEFYNVEYYMAYIKTSIRNDILRYGEKHKGEIFDLHAFWEFHKKLALLDEKRGYYGDDEGEVAEAQTIGWHLKVIPEDNIIIPLREYPEHRWLRGLNALRRREGWEAWPLSLLNYSSENQATIERTIKIEQKARWKIYKRVMTLLDDMGGKPAQQEIMRRFLASDPTSKRAEVAIAEALNISKQRVSDVVCEWMRTWGWNAIYLFEIRLILLTQHLAYLYSKRSTSHIDAEKLNELYNEVISSPETRDYFHDLQKSDDLGLMEICALCYEYWYSGYPKEDIPDRGLTF